MSFLKIKDKKVYCTEEGMANPFVEKVYNSDKTGKGKTFFNDVITAIFYLFTPRGIYWTKPLEERIKIVERNHISGKWRELVHKSGVKEMADFYIDMTQTVNDKLEDSMKTDMNNLLRELNNVPTTIEATIGEDAEVLCDDGVLHKVKVPKTITIPNFKGKKELWDTSLSFSKSLKEIQANLRQEALERDELEVNRRLYDEKGKTQVEKQDDIQGD